MLQFPSPDPIPLDVAQAFSVRGQTVIITGAAGWLGRKITEAFAVNGAHVIASDRPLPNLDQSIAPLLDAGHSVHPVPADLTIPADLEALVARATELGHGHLDSLIHCGGIPVSKPLLEGDTPDFDRVFHANVRSTWLLARACVPRMQARGGSIVNIASVNAHRPSFPGPLYASSKAAVINLTQELAVELAPHKIRANTISPGPVINFPKTLLKWTESLHPSHHQAFLDHCAPFAANCGNTSQPLPLGLRPVDIALAAIYLCSPAARVISGADILVDGAFLLRFPPNGNDPTWNCIHDALRALPDDAWIKPKPQWLK